MSPEMLAKWGQKPKHLNSYDYARDGDHLLTPFQCDLCVFRRIHHRNPNEDSDQDSNLLAFIRRMNLDAFWSRSTGTVSNCRSSVARTITGLKTNFGILDAPFYDPGPTQDYDTFGYKVALSVLQDSIRSGRYAKDHKQWQSVRKTKAHIASFEQTRADTNGIAALATNVKGSISRFQDGGSSSYWFGRFQTGCSSRMGTEKRQDQALSVNCYKRMLSRIDQKIVAAFAKRDDMELSRLTIGGAYLAISYVLGL